MRVNSGGLLSRRCDRGATFNVYIYSKWNILVRVNSGGSLSRRCDRGATFNVYIYSKWNILVRVNSGGSLSRRCDCPFFVISCNKSPSLVQVAVLRYLHYEGGFWNILVRVNSSGSSVTYSFPFLELSRVAEGPYTGV